MHLKSQIMLYNRQIVPYNCFMEKIMDYYNADGEYGKRGYLKEKYRIFNIRDTNNGAFEFHYHEFDKIVMFISGNVTYIIEGKAYSLQPYDILLIRHGDIHRPIIDSSVEYERAIIWLDNEYLKNHSLNSCFDTAKEKGLNLLRLPIEKRNRVFSLLNDFTNESKDDFSNSLMEESLLAQLMILICRAGFSEGNTAQYKSDKQIDIVLEYINKNLFSALTVDKIAGELYISRYYLMHKFKEVTGKTIFEYIQSKRLLHAASLLNNGISAKTACFESGYNDYSVFLKAFKKEFGTTPSAYIKL